MRNRRRFESIHRAMLPLTLATLVACGGGGGGSLGVPPPSPTSNLTLNNVAITSETHALRVQFDSSEYAETWLERFEGGSLIERVFAAGGGTSHAIDLVGLDAGRSQTLVLFGRDALGNVVSLEPFAAATEPASGPRSDGFVEANLDLGIWRLVDPFGVGEVSFFDEGLDHGLALGVPAGVAHDPWSHGNESLRLMQSVQDQDLSVTARFLNGLDQEGTGNGLIFEEGPDRWLRFDFSFYQSRLHVLAAAFAGGVVQHNVAYVLQSAPWPTGQPLEMRVSRVGDVWTQEWSTDGSVWSPGATFTFPLQLEQFGPTAINSGGSARPHTAWIDAISASGHPLDDDDVTARVDLRAPFVFGLRATALDDRTVRFNWRTDEPTLATLRWGLDDQHASGTYSTGYLGLSGSHTLRGLAAGQPHVLRLEVQDASGNQTWRGDIAIVPSAADGGDAPELNLWTADEIEPGSWVLDSGSRGNANQDLNLLGRLTDLDEVDVAATCQLQYRVNGGPYGALDLGNAPWIDSHPPRLAHAGDFNLEIPVDDLLLGPLVGGKHITTVELLATDDEAHVRSAVIRIEHTPDVTWTMGTTSFDDFLNAGLQARDAVQIVDGAWHLENHPSLGAVLRNDANELGYDRLAAIGEAHGPDAWTDYEVRTEATVLALDPNGYTAEAHSYALGFGLRWIGLNDGFASSQLDHDVFPLGGLFMYRWWDNGNARWQTWNNGVSTIANHYGVAPLTVGVTYAFRLRVQDEPGGVTRYQMRRWVKGTSEPVAWDIDLTTEVGTDPGAGSFLMVAHHVDAAFGPVTVTPLP